MMAREPHRAAERQALELLPWYVNGTLADDERELVRRQLLSSLTCRMEFERLRRLRQAMQREDGETAATERAFERLMARIAASGKSRSPRLETSQQNLVWSPLARAALLLAFVSGLVWWWFPAPSTAPQSYATLSATEPAETGITRLRVAFAPGQSERSRQELLAEYRLTIVGEPTRDGLYTLALARDVDARSVVAALKADPRIAFTSTPIGVEGR